MHDVEEGYVHVGIVIRGIVADDVITVSSISGPVFISTNINPPRQEDRSKLQLMKGNRGGGVPVGIVRDGNGPVNAEESNVIVN